MEDSSNDFYALLILSVFTFCNFYFSPRIFEIQRIWVDQRTLSLSMSPGGWTHQHVMDCFAALTMADQHNRNREGTLSKQEILKHITIKAETVSNCLLNILHSAHFCGQIKKVPLCFYIFLFGSQKILMDPMLKHSDPTHKNLFCPNNIGFRLENAGLVFLFFVFHIFQLWHVQNIY